LWNWTKLKLKKKPPFPTKGTAAYNPKQKCCGKRNIFVGVPYARTLNKFRFQQGFLTCVFPKNPSRSEISNLRFEISKTVVRLLWSSNAYSGATVTAFNRVPFSKIIIFFLKEQAYFTAHQNSCK
jgi:hypothetical protein